MSVQTNKPSWDNVIRLISWVTEEILLLNSFIFTIPFVTQNDAIFLTKNNFLHFN